MVCVLVGNSFFHLLQPNSSLRGPLLVISCVTLLLISKPHFQKWVVYEPDRACDSKIESFMHSEAISEPVWGEVYLLAFCFYATTTLFRFQETTAFQGKAKALLSTRVFKSCFILYQECINGLPRPLLFQPQPPFFPSPFENVCSVC